MRDQSEENEGESLLFKLTKSTEIREKQLFRDYLDNSDFRTYHPVCSEPSLDEACEDVRRVVTVVRDTGQAGVDGDHD